MNCNVCGAPDTQMLFTKQEIPYYSCRQCGFVFSKPARNANLENNIQDFEPAYLNYLQEQKHDRKNHDMLLKKLSKYKDLAGARVLDVGCGSGKFVRYLRARGHEAYGLEPSAALFQEFLRHEPFYFNQTVMEYAAAYPGGQFDIVTISDVLEHTDDPLAFLESAGELVKPGGLIFISTPDTRSIYARLAGKRWHYYNRYHLSLFSITNLDKLAGMFDLERVRSGHVTRFHSLHYIIQYIINFLSGSKRKVPVTLPELHLPVNLFDNLFAIYRRRN